MLSRYEENLIAQATTLGVGRLPQPGERLPVTRVKQVQIRVLEAAFYVRNTVPAVGQVVTVDADDAISICSRGLAELVPS